MVPRAMWLLGRLETSAEEHVEHPGIAVVSVEEIGCQVSHDPGPVIV